MVARHGGMVRADWLGAASGGRRGDRLRRGIRRRASGTAVELFPGWRSRLRHGARRHRGLARAAGLRSLRACGSDSFLLHPQWEEGLGYDDNVFGSGTGQRGSWLVGSHPSLLVGSDWSRDSLGGYLGADDLRYLDQPQPELHQLDGGAGRWTVRSGATSSRVGRAFRSASAAHRARCGAIGYAGRLSGERRAGRLHDRAEPSVGDAEPGVHHVSL